MVARGKDTTMRTLFLTTAAFVALVMIAPVGAAHAGVCRDTWLNRALQHQPNTPGRVAAVNGWISCINNNMSNAYTPAELDAATEEYKEFRNLTTAGREWLANH
jgi:hypothetical protein